MVFSIFENQRRVSHIKTKGGVSAGGIVMALCWQWPVVFHVRPLTFHGILLGIATGIAPVIAMSMSAQPQSPGPTFFFLYFLSFLFFYIYS